MAGSIPILVEVEQAGWMDMLVEKRVIVELKSVETMNPVYEAQIMTYLRRERGASWFFDQLQRKASKGRDQTFRCLIL